MGETTGISWTHHTFNPWRGCARVSPGCEHCYAETWAKRNPGQFGVWGVDGTRVVASEAMWREPPRWDRKAEQAGEKRRVFCASLADVGEDRPDLVAPRTRLCELILDTPNLHWLLLTKRIENMARLFPRQILELCWVGVTAEDQQRADQRIPILLNTPAGIRFVSYEPALGPVDFRPWIDCGYESGGPQGWVPLPSIDWIISGGESGADARPFNLAWPRAVIRATRATDTTCFVKQLGSKPYVDGGMLRNVLSFQDLLDPKGGKPTEWPDDLRVQEFPA